ALLLGGAGPPQGCRAPALPLCGETGADLPTPAAQHTSARCAAEKAAQSAAEQIVQACAPPSRSRVRSAAEQSAEDIAQSAARSARGRRLAARHGSSLARRRRLTASALD